MLDGGTVAIAAVTAIAAAPQLHKMAVTVAIATASASPASISGPALHAYNHVVACTLLMQSRNPAEQPRPCQSSAPAK